MQREIREFEKKLKYLVKKRKIIFPLDDKYLEEILEKAGKIEFSDSFYNRLLESAKKTMKKLKLENKLIETP